jgi:polyhydroxybutyrate depolymerase
MENESRWSQLADREGFIVIYPEGIGILGYLQHWNAGQCCGKAVRDDWKDVAFIEAAIDGMCRQYSVDRSRIYMVGFSNGGMMAYRFAAERPNKLAAIASVSGAIGSRASPDSPEWLLPVPERPVPVLIMHGASDETVPFDGGKPIDRASTREYRSVSDAVRFWTTANNCMDGPLRKFPFGGMVTEESWMDTGGRNEVRAYRILNWGHHWPGGSFTRTLPQNHPLKEFDAAQTIWCFFQQYPLD